MQFGRNLSDNMNYKYFSMMYHVSISMHLDQFTKGKSNIENHDEMYAMAF